MRNRGPSLTVVREAEIKRRQFPGRAAQSVIFVKVRTKCRLAATKERRRSAGATPSLPPATEASRPPYASISLEGPTGSPREPDARREVGGAPCECYFSSSSESCLGVPLNREKRVVVPGTRATATPTCCEWLERRNCLAAEASRARTAQIWKWPNGGDPFRRRRPSGNCGPTRQGRRRSGGFGNPRFFA